MSGLHDDEVLGRAYDARLMRRLLTFVRPHRGPVALSLLALCALAGVQLLQPWLIKEAIDRAIVGRQLQALALPALLYLATLIAEFLLRAAQVYVLERAGQSVVFDIRVRLFAHIQRLPAGFFDRNPVGRLVTRLTSDVEALSEAFTSGVVLVLADLVKLAGIVVILLWMDWRMALVTFTILPPLLGLTWIFRLRLREAYRQIRLLVARLNAFLQEHVSGMRVVQLFGQEPDTRARFAAIAGEHRDAQIAGVRYDALFSAITELMAAIALAAILWAGGLRILAGAITFGTLVAFIEYSGRFFGPLQELSQRYTVMQAAMAAAERIFRLLDTPATEEPAAVPAVTRPRPRGEVVFDGVTFGYGDGPAVLHDVSFRLRPGEAVGIVGWTGAGKSTLIRLLVRLYEPRAGRILLDGVDVREWDLDELRRAVGVVAQEPFLFAGTIESNLSLGDARVSPAAVRAAAAAVGAERFISRLPHGFAETVRERGSNLSVGEKQLLAFARALAFDPALLVLDEATASVDPETEAGLHAALETSRRGRTALIIAHRLATLRGVDRILVLHHGQLREQGTHAELLRVPDGIYRRLHALQTAG